MGWAIEGLLCMPVATTTCEVGTVIMVGAAGADVCAMATAVFLTVFFGDSEEIGTLLSSYSFLFTVLFIWALQDQDTMTMCFTPPPQWLSQAQMKNSRLTRCALWSQCWCCSGRLQSDALLNAASRSRSPSTWLWDTDWTSDSIHASAPNPRCFKPDSHLITIGVGPLEVQRYNTYRTGWS